MVDRTKLAVFLGHHAETRAVEVSKRRGQIWACSLLAETGHVQVGGDEVAVGKGRGEVGGRGPPSRALVADVEALGQAMKNIGDKGGIRVVVEEGLHPLNTDGGGWLKGRRRGRCRQEAGDLRIALMWSAAVGRGGTWPADGPLRTTGRRGFWGTADWSSA